MTFCGDATIWAKACLILMIIALALQSAGYGTNYWIVRYAASDKVNYGIGLWQMTNCSGSYDSPCLDGDISPTFKTRSLKAVIGLESCALILMFVPAVCMLFYVGSRRSRTFGMAVTVMIFIFIAAVFDISGMAVLIRHMPAGHYPGWSMGLTVFSSALCITAAVLVLRDMCEYEYKDLLKVGGEFQNLTVTREPVPPLQDKMYDQDIAPMVEPQGRHAAPTYQYLNRDKRRKVDGF